MIKVIIIILLTLSTASSAFGADWSVSWTGIDEKHDYQKLADEQEYQFTIARFHCNVSKIALDKIYNDVFERRYLSCSISRDTSVLVDLSYNVRSADYDDARTLVIRDKGKTFIATLFVHQHK